ncbi:NADPH-dependent butanol dehydrogenase [Clostridium pasteurianum DSM 525 = ATCC 6013]|uniref:Alcohol dehydrogenase n=1 Tax=Clostridium pasteurianum DSM 525 = ATCC 6013 TaxID=1262449 RepID=A0A0H3J8Z6_CLOPA|nr:iron-containing alcohol dehydrogenase [Clostridium pasteurianum]AJA48468.1 NADPH-dependent butanol dehydrogenase [Clostridium pasteurianum DSM 525 = ATCC 6013]AJA52456.1 NADPH-dependent butanol dehydrogenase [Clostridium pasteurianum DSM 525 = ATCC 6013]AOZ75709.1 butanol dehydrogenase [Clostridium pasteurianum DSM 525 = ATCC 6013]AOZ79505.1 butanol dehydrogenase [Clostridium pasteurianum]ELP60385.1 iron-containing alcohol dehydrogenase [Clostridium pasteurianum DSM 525 = ATCC 6013]
MQRFTIPRDIYFGDNAIEHLKSVKGTKAMLVIGSERLIKDGTVPKIQELLKETNIETTVFSGVENDPSVATVRRGVEVMENFNPDLIIGIGGGSPIDAAKAMWIFYEYPEFTFEEAAKPFNLRELRQKAKFIAIPTTSGTGTEVTSFSVITDHETGIKYPIADYNITPDVAIVDTNLVQSMTKTLVANTGMDALTHAFEAYVSTVRNPITDALAMKSIEMTVDNLVKSFKEEEKARKDMHISQCLAGMSFSNAILGIVHSMSHKTGKIFNIPHGCANAIYLSYAIQFNAKKAGAAYADIAKRLGLKGKTSDELVQSLIQLVKDFRVAMNMPATLKEFGLSEKDFKSKLDEISKSAVADPCTGTNPREISVEEMKKLFEATYYGTEVNF